MDTLHGTAKTFPADLQTAVSHYRHAIFIERLGWDLPVENGSEKDQFDRDDTVYVVARNANGEVTGCARLLPTTSAYLLGDIFPQLMNGLPVPSQSDVWELSRFSSTDLTASASATRREALEHTRQLLSAAVDSAASYGARRLITVSPLGIERLLSRMGVNSHRAGPPVLVDGKPVFACWIEIDNQTLTALGLPAAPVVNTLN